MPSSGHSPASSSAPGSSLNLDQTRRDLLELPASAKPGQSSSPLLPNVSGPELPGQSNATFAPPPSTPEQSPTWLADAMRQTEIRSRHGSQSYNSDRSDASASDRRFTNASENSSTDNRTPTQTDPNSLAAYVTRWTRSTDNLPSASGSLSHDPLSSSANSPLPSSPAAAQTLIPLGQPTEFFPQPVNTRPNPYLEAMNLDPNSFNTATADETPVSTPPLPSANPPVFLLPTLGQSKPLLQNPAPPTPIPQPTQDLIDERKYFPQLRRF